MCPVNALRQPTEVPKPSNHLLRELAPEMAPEGLQEDLDPGDLSDPSGARAYGGGVHARRAGRHPSFS